VLNPGILLARLKTWLRWSRWERDLDDELHTYVSELTARNERDGLSPEAARRAALVEVGGLEVVKEHVRSVRVGHVIESIAADVRYGCRVLAKAPTFSAVVVLTIALGIGINVAMFSLMHGVLWRPLPYPEPKRIVAIEVVAPGVSTASFQGEPLDFRQQARLVRHLGTINGVDANVTVDGVMERVAAVSASDEVLPLLGATPLALGRPLDDQEDEGPTYVRGVVISYELWQRMLSGDPHVLGRHVQVNDLDVQVVGVTRPGFRVYLPPGHYIEEHVDVWFPIGFEIRRAYRGIVLLGRLAPGATLAQAQAEADSLAAAFAAHALTASTASLRFRVQSLDDVVTRHVRPALMALGIAVSLVLLIACVNVANLMVARAKSRERELSVRRALGATRMRLIRQVLTENLVFTFLGAAGGWLIAHAGLSIVAWLRPSHLPRQADVAMDGTVLAWTACVAVLSSVGFGLLPAWTSTRARAAALTAGRATTMRRTRNIQRTLVIVEVALSIVLLIGAGLMLRTFVNLTTTPIGFDPARVVTARVSLSFRLFTDVDQRWNFLHSMIDRVRGIPGVEDASIGSSLPFVPLQTSRRYWREGDVNPVALTATQEASAPHYLAVMGIQLRAGRDVTDEDVTQRRSVVIVDERIARQLWHGDAVGKRLSMERGQRTDTLEVVGVTASTRSGRVRDEGDPTLFVPYHVYPVDPQTLVVKTHVPVGTIGPILKQTIEAFGSGRPVFDIKPMTTIVEDSFDDERFVMLVLGGFAVVALLLAGIGLYGTLAYLISQRTQEFGVRVALGASATRIVCLVAREGGFLAGLGVLLGVAGAMGVTRSLQGLLYGVTPLDALTITGVVVLVMATAVIAVGRPAWAAARVDPNVALRRD
jgi:putative ABC transport system permease protein